MKKKYLFYASMMLMGFLTREMLTPARIDCPRCGISLSKPKFSTECDVKCDSCGYMYPVKSYSICGISLFTVDHNQFSKDINHYQQ